MERKIAEIESLANQLLSQYGLDAEGWRFEWDNGKRRAGACHYGTRRITGSRHVLPNASDAEITETLLHEIAHALTPGHSHDGVWRKKLLEMGGTGARTHNMETPKGRYEVVCAKCGVVGYRHQAQGSWKVLVNRPEGFATYTHRKCNGRLWLRDTKGMGSVLPAQPKPVQVPVVETHATAASEPAGNPARVCFCGCNGTTKGGFYLPGHDARHVSEVFAGWLANRHDLDGAKHLLRHSPKLQAKLEARIAAYAEKHYKG